jgi:phage tail sheath protein FI
MPEYLSPGVYVEEVPSVIKPIAGVSTSTAAFLGVVPDSIQVPEENPQFDPSKHDPSKPPDPANLPYRMQPFPYPDSEVDKARKAFETLAEPNVRPPKPKGKPTPEDYRRFREVQEELALAVARHDASDLAPAGHPVLCTTFAEFTRHFGGF